MEIISLEENIKKLRHKFKMSDDILNLILSHEKKEEGLGSYLAIEISTLLIDMDSVDETQRVCHIIDHLHNNLGLSYEPLAVFSEVSLKEFEDFLSNPDVLSEKKKFVLAVRIMYLHFILKEKYLIDN